jgi:(R,R)-butanediol dehydrogenase/meso-butanediol dehydrogenase/diacetyl reductase
VQVVTIHGQNDVRLDEVEAPKPTDSDVVVDIKACGICGTDLSFIKMGGMPQPDGRPMRLGHEAVGVVTQVGSKVRGIDVGLHVVLNPQGLESEVIGNGGPEGMLGNQVLIREAQLGWSLVPLPADLPWDIAALTEPLAVSMHGVNRADPKPDEKVVVFGAGPIGIGVVVWLVERGVSDIVVVDPAQERLEHAKAVGARVVIQPQEQNLREALGEAHGTEWMFNREAVSSHVYIDAAGAPSILPDVIGMARKHARLVVIAAHYQPVQLSLGAMLTSEMSITTSMGYPTELPDVVAALPRVRDKVAPMITHRFPIERAVDAFQVAGTATATKVLVEFADGSNA